MDKHKCKLCLRTFPNGRALGGHMRSHMLNLPIPPKPEEEEEEEAPIQLSEDTKSASSSSSEEEEEEEEEEGEEGDDKGLYYGLRENPKKSIRLVDPEFSFAVDAGSVVLQDRESETESSKNPTRRRSKRTRKSTSLLEYHLQYCQPQQRQEQDNIKKLKFNKLGKTESWAVSEPVSSISDATTEEDVAFCLMMLSRDKWKRKEAQEVQEQQEQQEKEDEEEAEKSMEETDESDELKFCKNRSRGKYKCDTCKKVFKSYQALGGHRASHKKIKLNTPIHQPEFKPENAGTSGSCSASVVKKKVHECPVCFRVFASGQALGGHKRTHVIGVATSTATPVKSSTKFGDNWIDLNLPAPIDDDDISQIELSAVSDAEFVNHIRR